MRVTHNIHTYISYIILFNTMASSGFTISNVNALMELLDDNKDNMTEGEYLQMCNALSALYKTTQSQMITTTNLDYGHDNIHRFQYLIENIRNGLANTAHFFRIASVDRKINALMKTYPQISHNIYSQHSWTSKSNFVKAVEKHLIEYNGLPKHTIKETYKNYLDDLDLAKRLSMEQRIAAYEEYLRRLG